MLAMQQQAGRFHAHRCTAISCAAALATDTGGARPGLGPQPWSAGLVRSPAGAELGHPGPIVGQIVQLGCAARHEKLDKACSRNWSANVYFGAPTCG